MLMMFSVLVCVFTHHQSAFGHADHLTLVWGSLLCNPFMDNILIACLRVVQLICMTMQPRPGNVNISSVQIGIPESLDSSYPTHVKCLNIQPYLAGIISKPSIDTIVMKQQQTCITYAFLCHTEYVQNSP